MRFSVIIPTYNRLPLLKEALESVWRQTFTDYEVIVVDDGSVDDTRTFLESHSSQVPLRYIQQQNQGPAAARLAGIKKAQGEWIAYLDSDDVWYPEHLENARRFLVRANDVAYMSHLHAMWHHNGSIFVPKSEPLFRVPRSGLSDIDFLAAFERRWYFSPSSVVQRRDVVLAVGGPDPGIKGTEDVDLFLRVIAGRTWCYNPAADWIYRVGNPGQVSANRMGWEQNMLNVLLKNEHLYSGSVMDRAIHKSSRRTIAMAFTDGSEEDRRRAWETAWQRLNGPTKAFFWGMRQYPAPFRIAIRAKRWLRNLVNR